LEGLRFPPPAAAGRLDAQDIAGLQIEGELAGQIGLLSVTDEAVAAQGTGLAAGKAPGGAAAALGEDRDGDGREEAQVAAQALAAGMEAGAARAAAERVALDADGKGVLEGFDGGVAGVGHMD